MPTRRAPKAVWVAAALAMLVPAGLAFAWSASGDHEEPRQNTDLNTSSVGEFENSALPFDYVDIPTSSQQETVIRAPSTGNAGMLETDARAIEAALVVAALGLVAGSRWVTGRGTRVWRSSG